jgi:hypothetical protein
MIRGGGAQGLTLKPVCRDEGKDGGICGADEHRAPYGNDSDGKIVLLSLEKALFF